MPPKPKHTIKQTKKPVAQREFTDREEPQKSFQKALLNTQNKECSILNFYGVGGIGKSSLQRHLIDKHLKDKESTIYSWIDFEIPNNRNSHEALKKICQNFKSGFKDMRFVAFDIAYTVYKSKENPELAIKDKKLPFLDEGSIVAETIENLTNVTGGFGTIAMNLTNIIYSKYKGKLTKDINEALKSLNSLEHYEILDKLPMFLAYDIAKYIKDKKIENCVIFFDTYEALWEDKRTQANEYTKDAWVREFISTLLSQDIKPLFVISGREELIWDKHSRDWTSDDIEQHILGGLSDIDSKSFLRSCDIKDEQIQEAIIKVSKDERQGCLPYYLDLCVDTYLKIENPTIKDFENLTPSELFERFIRYLDKEETATLKILAHTRFYTRELFQEIIKRFNTGYPATDINILAKFSFISKDENSLYTIHDIMKKSLIDKRKSDDIELHNEIKEFLFHYYDKKLLNIENNEISDDIKTAFGEAYYLSRQVYSEYSCSEWFDTLYKVFFSFGEYIFIKPFILININQIGTDNTNTISHALEYNRIGVIYHNLGQYSKALEFYKRALDIRKYLLGDNDIKTSQTYNNIALLYHNIGDYKNALINYEYSINGKELNDDILSLAKSYSNLARLKRDTKNYIEAIELYKKTLLIYKDKNIKDRFYATDLSRLGTVCQNIGDKNNAIIYLKEALIICRKDAGSTHPYTATCLKNLALFYKNEQQYEKAKVLLEESYNIRINKLGNNHHKTIEISDIIKDIAKY